MNIKAYAKINIGLDVTGTREDGYHLLDMIMQTVGIYDEISIDPREDNDLNISFDDPNIPTDERCLIRKAVRLLTDRGFDITVRTIIPTQAGMGGGSSDAAETLKAVNTICGLGKTEEELEKLEGLDL